MKLKIKILDSSGNEKKELVIDVPPNITIDGLIETLRKKRPDLFDAKEYTANVEIPTNKPLSSKLLDDDSLVIIRHRGWDWDVRIVEG